MMIVNDNPGIGQKEMCEQLQLAPSTVTRFIDTLVHKGYLNRQSEGKVSHVYPTEAGEKLKSSISEAWKSLHKRYDSVLGREKGDALTTMIDAASDKLSKQG